MRKFSVVAPLCLLSGIALAHPSESFLPKNDLHKQDHLFWNNSEINEEKFGEIIDHVGAIYEPIIKAHGGKLVIEKNWKDPTVNAYAMQQGSTWTVAMFGGLARRPETTPDGFALVVCHELGHHLAGFAFYGDGDWAASEGQSDYFATQACSRMIWGEQKEENAKSAATVHPTAKRKCDASWSTEDDRNLCYRTAMGGKSLADLLSALGGTTADFDKPDTTQVSRTDVAHPEGQCRLDTYFNGALCTAQFDSSLIPGRHHPDGQTSKGAEREAAQFSCMASTGFVEGLRPRCWFKPALALELLKDEMTISEVNGNNNGAWEPGETVGLNIPLYNGLGSEVSGATLALTSDNSAVQAAGVSTYPNIEANQSKAANDSVQVSASPSLQCGSRVKLKAVAKTSNSILEENLEFMLGRMQSAATAGDAVNKVIPDGNARGLVIANTFSGEQKVLRAKVTLDVKHDFPSDLHIMVMAPSGRAYSVYRYRDAVSDIKQTYTVDIDNEMIAGEWKLVLTDTFEGDEGILRSYNIDLESVSCDGAMTLVRK